MTMTLRDEFGSWILELLYVDCELSQGGGTWRWWSTCSILIKDDKLIFVDAEIRW